jgi:DNA-binding transcriptional ArsR family regulator
MLSDVDLAHIGFLIGDRRRAGMLLALLGGEDLPAGELGARVGASSSLASAHLNRLREAGLVRAERVGRRRLYRIAGPDVAQALEALVAVAPGRPATSLREARQGEALRHARTCYDHLAGELGVALTDALRRQGSLDLTDAGFALTPTGRRRLTELGVDIASAQAGRRTFIRHCIDWTERRPHLAGALGAAIATRFFDLGWVSRRSGSRALDITPVGSQELRARFGLG